MDGTANNNPPAAPPAAGLLRQSSVAAPAAPAAAAPVATSPYVSLAYMGERSSSNNRSPSARIAQWVNVDPDTGRKVDTAAAAAAPPAGGQSPDFVAESPPLEPAEKQERPAAASSSAKSSAAAKPTRDDLKAIMAHAMLVVNNDFVPTGTSKDADNAEEHTNVARVKHSMPDLFEDCKVVPSEVADKLYNPEDPDTVSSLRAFASDYVKASGAAFKPLDTLLLGLTACSVMWSGMKAKFKPWFEQTAVRTAVYVSDILDVVPAQKGGRFDCVPIVDQNGKKIFLSCGSLDALHCAISSGKMADVYERNPRISKYPYKYAVSALPTKETARGKLYCCSYENLPPAYRISGSSAVIWGLGKRRTLVVHDEEDRFPNAPENKPSWIHLFKEAGFTLEQAEALSGNPSKYVPVGAPSADPASSVYAETKNQVAAKISKIKDLPDGFDLLKAVDTIFDWKTVIETAGLPVPRGRSTIPQETLDGCPTSDVLRQNAGYSGMSTKELIEQLCLRCIAEEYRLEACFAAKVVKFMFTHYGRDGLPVFNCVMVFQSKYTVAEQSRLDAVCKTVAASRFGLIPNAVVGNKRSAPDGADDVNEEGAGAKRARVAETKTIYVFDDNEKNLARAKEHYAKNHPGYKVVLVHVPTAGPKMDEDGNVEIDANGHKKWYTWAQASAVRDAGDPINVPGLASQAEKFENIVSQLNEYAEVKMDLDCCFLPDSTNQRNEYSHDELLKFLKDQGIYKRGERCGPFYDQKAFMTRCIREVLDHGASLTFYTANNKASTIRRLRDVWELPEDDIKRCGLICGTQIMMNGAVEITPKHELLGGEVKTIGQLGFWDDIAL